MIHCCPPFVNISQIICFINVISKSLKWHIVDLRVTSRCIIWRARLDASKLAETTVFWSQWVEITYLTSNLFRSKLFLANGIQIDRLQRDIVACRERQWNERTPVGTLLPYYADRSRRSKDRWPTWNRFHCSFIMDDTPQLHSHLRLDERTDIYKENKTAKISGDIPFQQPSWSLE